MELAKYKACICEGSAESAIMDMLLDYGLLIFSREEMIEEEVIRCREGKKFEEKYLRKGFMDKISVIRILDSRRENFKLSKAYAGKVDVINVITAPEIEMLIIFNEDKYKEFKKSGKKPSSFCKEDLKMLDFISGQLEFENMQIPNIYSLSKYKNKGIDIIEKITNFLSNVGEKKPYIVVNFFETIFKRVDKR